ncbi:MAG: ABC transporter permease subunit [Clostridiales Family XIII bacterium]|nr:ABC transporter permease subunit [Clostridiales Family XIII bacterium]
MKKGVRIAFPYLGAAIIFINYYTIPSLAESRSIYPIILTALLIVYTVVWIASFRSPKKIQKVLNLTPKLFVGALALTAWDILTVRMGVLPLPFFQSFERIMSVFVDDWHLLLKSLLHSLRLLFTGYLIGMATGLVTGVFIGWYPKVNYWIMPIVKAIGPIPATVWIPLIIVIMPTMFGGSVFLIALAVWFPATLMTATGILSTPNTYFEVARTLGADSRYLIFRVAIPSALPSIFMGMFIGMGVSCVTLISAEMLGVKAGLGWYITKASGWTEYHKVYASIIIILITFTTIITLIFKIRDKVLVWQKNEIKW